MQLAANPDLEERPAINELDETSSGDKPTQKELRRNKKRRNQEMRESRKMVRFVRIYQSADERIAFRSVGW